MSQNVAQMCSSNSLVLLEESMEQRILMTKEDYIDKVWPNYQQLFPDNAEQKFSDFVLGSLSRIKKRLGGVRFKALHQSFEQALAQLFTTGNSDLFSEGIHILLKDYYDPMYTYQLSKRKDKIIFKGHKQEVLEWANNQ